VSAGIGRAPASVRRILQACPREREEVPAVPSMTMCMCTGTGTRTVRASEIRQGAGPCASQPSDGRGMERENRGEQAPAGPARGAEKSAWSAVRGGICVPLFRLIPETPFPPRSGPESRLATGDSRGPNREG
jgi:hypothetical protein